MLPSSLLGPANGSNGHSARESATMTRSDGVDATRSDSGQPDAFARSRLEAGVGHWQRGDHERAIAEFTAALALDDTLAAAYAQRGEVRRLTGDYEAAIRDYDHALQLDPANARLLFNR